MLPIVLSKTVFPKLGIAREMEGKVTTAGAAAVGRAKRGQPPTGKRGVDRAEGCFRRHDSGGSSGRHGVLRCHVAGSIEVSGAKALLAFLASERAAGAIKKSEMELPQRR